MAEAQARVKFKRQKLANHKLTFRQQGQALYNFTALKKDKRPHAVNRETTPSSRVERPMHTFYSSWCDLQKDYGHFEIGDVFSYDKFKNAWYAFLKLLDIDYEKNFSCPICSPHEGDDPDLVICDGTSVGFQRRMWTFKFDTDGDKKKVPKTR